MLEPIAGLPENVIGFVAKGELTSQDYEKELIPAVDRGAATPRQGPPPRRWGGQFDGLTAGAIWDDTKVGFLMSPGGRRSPWSPTRTGSHSVDLFGYLIPGEVKAFDHGRRIGGSAMDRGVI